MSGKTLAGLTGAILTVGSFAYGDWTVRSTCGTNGVIAPSGIVHPGGTPASFTVTAAPAYHIAEVYTNGVPYGFLAAQNVTQTVASVSLGVLSDHATVHAEFSRDEVSGYALGAAPAAPSIIPAVFRMDVSNLWGYAACGAMPVDNSNQWAAALADGWTWPPLGGAMPVQCDSAALVVAYPPLKRPPAPLDLHVAALPGGSEFDLFWRFDDSHAEAREALVEYRDLDVPNSVFTSVGLIACDTPFTNAFTLTTGKRYAFRIAAKGNGYFSDYSEPFVLSTYVTNGLAPTPGLSPVDNVVTVRADVAGLDWPAGGATAVIHGSQSGTRSTNAIPVFGGKAFAVAAGPLFPGEEAWVVVTAQTNGPHATAATPHAWQAVGGVRFGGGTFNAQAAPRFYRAVLADLNGDDKLDCWAVTATNKSSLTYYRCELWTNNEATPFPLSKAWTNGVTRTDMPIALCAADVNGDGRSDILCGWSNGEIELYRNDGSGIWAPESVATNAGQNDLCAADMDLDGDVDLIVGVNGPNRIYLNNGTGHFALARETWDEANTVALAVADLNGDGLPDVACADRDVGYSVWLNAGAGRLRQRLQDWTGANPDAPSTVTDVEAADLDKDGDTDLIFAHNGIENQVWLNTGGAVFTADQAFDNGGNTTILKVGDVRGSGNRACVWGNNPGLRVWQRGDSQVKEEDGIGGISDLALGDLSGDDALDILVCGTTTKYFINRPPPPAVSGFTLSGLGDTWLSFSWLLSEAATGCIVYRIDINPLGSAVTQRLGVVNGCTFSNLTLNAIYRCSICATNEWGAGPWVNPEIVAQTGDNGVLRGVPRSWFADFFPDRPFTLANLDTDDDGDGRTTWEEYVGNSDPRDSDSVFEITGVLPTATGVALSWPGSEGRLYSVERAPALNTGWQEIDTLPGQSGTNAYEVNRQPGVGAGFFRIRVQLSDAP